ncbi:hypothetical protein [Rhodococcus rhodochrous]|uniref:hypothetical protein n=1 Tax=Rhodococcus rhodochrous TaxID=1829 RepID=UPI0024BB8F98|nr:hypothetical protein [Rhodococcus rhodochrous]MDJ0401728.1 hypothetical protein [Rhodococcus rhodochrous]
MSKLNGAVRRAVQIAAGVAATAAVIISGAGGASAASPPVTPSPGGDNIWPIINLDRCGGPIQVSRGTVPGRTDLLGVTLTPTGNFGASSECVAPVKLEWVNGIAPFGHAVTVTVDRPGPTRVDIPIGAGASLLTVQTLGVPAFGTSQYVWMQP